MIGPDNPAKKLTHHSEEKNRLFGNQISVFVILGDEQSVGSA
jgi:hypothetical protein